MASLTDRLEHLRRLEEDAYRPIEPSWRIDLRPSASRELLDNLERDLGRHLSADVRELYSWHDGCGGKTAFVPLIDFSALHIAKQIHDGIQRSGSFAVTNDADSIELSDLFPVLNHEAILFCTRLDRSIRRSLSPLYVLDMEFGQLTKEASSLRDFIDHLIGLLERGQFEVRGGHLSWTEAPYRFEPDIEPYGSGT